MTYESPAVKIARTLSDIISLCAGLKAQAEADANSPLMPGGLATVALADVAPPSAYIDALEIAERTALDNDEPFPETGDLPNDWEPPLQTMLFWSEQWREVHGYPLERRPTVESEARFIKWALDWAWDNELHWDDFAKDMRDVKARLENLLHDGIRVAFRGAPCLYDECKGKRLVRKTVPARDKHGNKVWRLTDWHCPSCKRSWSEVEYTRNTYAAIERAHFAAIADDTWATPSRAARRVGRPESTIRTWIHRGDVASMCLVDDSQKWTFVLLDDVIDRDQLARERADRTKRGKLAAAKARGEMLA